MSLGEVCTHGSLKRQCLTCEVEAERDQLLQTLAKERDAFGKRETELMVELAEVKANYAKEQEAHRKTIRILEDVLTHNTELLREARRGHGSM